MAALGLAEIAEPGLQLGGAAGAGAAHRSPCRSTSTSCPATRRPAAIPDSCVRTELAFQETQVAKRRASGHLSRGETGAALSELRRARDIAMEACAACPEDMSLRDEVDMVGLLLQEAEYGDVSRAAKLSSSDSSFKSRTRGRSA